MRLFIELSTRAFQRQIVYRAAAFAGFLTNLFFGFLRVAVLVALYGTRPEVAGISLQGAITFTGLSQAAIGFTSLFGWYELINSVYTGNVGTDLLKPLNLYHYWMAQDFGRALGQLLLRGLPIILAYAFIFDISVPKDFKHWLAVWTSISLAWMVSFSWRFLVNLASFWIPNALGIARFAFITSWFFSGFLMPLRYFPDWLVKLSLLTPFPHTVNTIIEVYLGLLKGSELLKALLFQLIWVVILYVVGQWILRLGIRKLVILGG